MAAVWSRSLTRPCTGEVIFGHLANPLRHQASRASSTAARKGCSAALRFCRSARGLGRAAHEGCQMLSAFGRPASFMSRKLVSSSHSRFGFTSELSKQDCGRFGKADFDLDATEDNALPTWNLLKKTARRNYPLSPVSEIDYAHAFAIAQG